MDQEGRLTSLELVAVLSLLDCTYVDGDARTGLHHLLEWYLNDLRGHAMPKLTGGVDLKMVSFLLEK
jgi:hypothetical protein